MKRYIGKKVILLAAVGCLLAPQTVFASGNSLSDRYDQVKTLLGTEKSGSNPQTTTAAGPDRRVYVSPGQNTGGPGVKSSTNDDTSSVQEITLSEQYYSDFEMYEEGINGLYYFYTNTGNGSITDQAVYLDIPSNITYTAELDGQSINYESKAQLTARGTYVFRFYAVYHPSEDGAKQVEYRATFRFRIQDKPVKPAKSQPDDSISQERSSGYGQTEDTDSLSKDDIGAVLSRQRITASEVTDLISEGRVSLSDMADILGVDPEKLADYLGISQDGNSARDRINSLLESDGETEPGSEEETMDETLPEEEEAQGEDMAQAASFAAYAHGRGTGAGLAETWDAEKQMYQEELLTGTVFEASVQNGATVNGTVSFQFPQENTLIVNVTRNGQSYEYTPGDDFTESGWYCLFLQDTVSGYQDIYEGKETPRFYFQIINEPVKDLSILFVPEGEKVTGFRLDGDTITDHTSWVSFKVDGLYELTYTTLEGEEKTVSITRDTVGPKLNAEISRGTAAISSNEELAYLTVYKDGEPVETDNPKTVTGSGKYVVYGADLAGNTTSLEFTIKRHISAATVIAILLVLCLIVSLAAFVVKVKRSTTMR